MKKHVIFKELTNRRKVTESDKHKAYYTLGIISTAFAEMEQRLQDLLVCFMKFETPIGVYFVERNNLETNLQLLSSIYKWLHDESLKKIVDKIGLVKQDRNNLIHGTWEIEKRLDYSLIIYVRKGKPQHIPGRQGQSPDIWTRATVYEYEFKELEQLTVSISEITELLKNSFNHYEANKPYI